FDLPPRPLHVVTVVTDAGEHSCHDPDYDQPEGKTDHKLDQRESARRPTENATKGLRVRHGPRLATETTLATVRRSASSGPSRPWPQPTPGAIVGLSPCHATVMR